MFTEKITFCDGFLVGNQVFTDAVLEEEVFLHTLKASSLPGIDVERLDDQAYFTAAKMAVRLKVPGLFEARMVYDEGFRELVEDYADAHDMKVKQVTAVQVHPVSVKMVEELSRDDGRLLIGYGNILAKRRSEFRKEALADPDGHHRADEVGVHREPGPGERPGGD